MDDRPIPCDSLLFRFDPRLKLMLVLFFSILIAVAKNPFCLAAGALLSLTAIIFSGLTVRRTLMGMVPVNTMVLFLWFFLPFSLPGQTIFAIGPVLASIEGVQLALAVTVKANVLMLLFVAYTASTPLITTGQALSRLGLSCTLTHLFFFSYRYIDVIYEEYRRLKTAMIIRGFVPKTSVHTYRTYAYLVGMVLVKSANRAERIHQAMLCRGFHGRFYSLKEFFIDKKDAVMFIVISVWITGMGLLEWITRHL